MTEGRHAADWKASRFAHRVSIDSRALVSTRSCSELLLVELIRSTDVRHHHFPVDGENETLDDLTDRHPDRVRRILGRFRPLGESTGSHFQPEHTPGLDNPHNVGMLWFIHRWDPTSVENDGS
jgi:hypothetical protein